MIDNKKPARKLALKVDEAIGYLASSAKNKQIVPKAIKNLPRTNRFIKDLLGITSLSIA